MFEKRSGHLWNVVSSTNKASANRCVWVDAIGFTHEPILRNKQDSGTRSRQGFSRTDLPAFVCQRLQESLHSIPDQWCIAGMPFVIRIACAVIMFYITLHCHGVARRRCSIPRLPGDASKYPCGLAIAAHLEPHFPGRAPLPNHPTRVMNLLRSLERSFPCPVSSARCSSLLSLLSVAADTPPTNRKPNATSNAMPKALASMMQRTTNASRVTKPVAQNVPWRNLARFNTFVQNEERLLNNG